MLQKLRVEFLTNVFIIALRPKCCLMVGPSWRFVRGKLNPTTSGYREPVFVGSVSLKPAAEGKISCWEHPSHPLNWSKLLHTETFKPPREADSQAVAAISPSLWTHRDDQTKCLLITLTTSFDPKHLPRLFLGGSAAFAYMLQPEQLFKTKALRAPPNMWRSGK